MGERRASARESPSDGGKGGNDVPKTRTDTAIKREPEPCPTPEKDEAGDLLLLALLLLVIGENGQSDKLLALILAGLLLIGK